MKIRKHGKAKTGACCPTMAGIPLTALGLNAEGMPTLGGEVMRACPFCQALIVPLRLAQRKAIEEQRAEERRIIVEHSRLSWREPLTLAAVLQ